MIGPGFTFVHVPKTGGSSIELALSAALGLRWEPEIWDGEAVPRIDDKHASADQYHRRDPAGWAASYTFGFVRNPWDWLVSRWHWSRDRQGWFDWPFEEFLARVEQRDFPGLPYLHRATAPQKNFLAIDGRIAVDYVGRFERLEADYRRVCRAIGVARRPLPRVLRTRRAHYRTYYRDADRDRVARLYAADLRAFGYTF